MNQPAFGRWLQQPFTFPDLTGQRVLVLGLGGGSDILLAHAIAQLFPPGARTVIYANTKTRDDDSLDFLSPHIARLKLDLQAPGRGKHGTTEIDQMVPRGDEGCPWIFLHPGEAAANALTTEIQAQKFDRLIGVDTGGDCLAGRSESGRDRRMLRVLQGLGLPLLTIVAAPGSDGDFTSTALHRAFTDQENQGRYRGFFSLVPTFPTLRATSQSLSNKRTPRIILGAVDGTLPADEDGCVTVPRGIKPKIPVAWLTSALVFEMTP